MSVMLAATLIFGAIAPPAAGITSRVIIPRATDSAISDDKFNTPHNVYVNRPIIVDGDPRDRHQLLVFIPGTNGNAQGARSFCELAADLGYHVINLMYPDDIAATVCKSDRDPRSFEDFRMAIIQGGQTTHITISRADSIENRLQKLLLYLKPRWPREHWGEFLGPDDGIRWEKIAVAGQSQGGGHAILIGLKHRVARVIGTGAPKDYSNRLNAPAAWYGDASATPKACFFTFNHRQDVVGCTPEQLQRNLSALGLDAFGAPIDVATEAFPYHHTRILTTSYPALTVIDEASATAAHTSVIANKNAVRWKEAWTYMLTENAP